MRIAVVVGMAQRLASMAVLVALLPQVAASQELVLSARAPRFLLVEPSRAAPVPVEINSSALLRRVVSLDVERPTVGRLLAAIERQTGIRFGYSGDVVPVDRPVALRAEAITVGAALLSILMDAGVDVLLSADGKVALVQRPPPARTGTVAGRVTDAKTGQGLVGAEVWLEGTRRRAATAENGYYRLADVEAGSYTLAVRRIGYGRRTRPVTVVDDQEAVVDLALEPVPTKLDEVVVTATGEQRLRELGHVVGRINADSLVREAPVSNVSELLTGRVPGLQVFQRTGGVGGEVQLQIRGPNSFQLSTTPIVVVDGVRYTSGAAELPNDFPANAERGTPLNDMNPNDIASIEVVKGPSAATLYGTDAANGVIVITTKRGRPGPARWNAYVKGATTAVPAPAPFAIYWGWQTVRGTPSLTSSCALSAVARRACVQDSVTVLPDPLDDPALTIFSSEPRWNYGLDVAGGQQDLRYYFSGDLERAVGPVRMPEAIVELLKARRGVSELPDEQVRPNALRKLNVRANLAAMVGEESEVRMTAGYLRSSTRALSSSGPYPSGVARANPANPYGVEGMNPENAFSETTTEDVDRFFGSVNGQWRPAPWLLTRALVGLDLGTRGRFSLARPGETPGTPLQENGFVVDERGRQLALSAEAGATATARRGRLSLRTSFGAQYVRNLANTLSATALGLPPGGSSISDGAATASRQTYFETVTFGSYLEETLGLNDRLFVTGALRADGASAFGQHYDVTVYPKIGVSWLLSEEPFVPRVPGLDELRFRYAYGASGQQPKPGWALPRYETGTVIGERGEVTTIGTSSIGNARLRPERVREHEIGVDAAVWQRRLQVGLTWYRRKTVDQIVSVELPPGLGSIFSNLGLTTQHGFEIELSARVLDTRAVSLDLTAQHGLHRTRLVDIGSTIASRPARGGGWVEGYPLGSRFQREIVSYADANGDGIIVPSEVQLTAEEVYAGESTPPLSQTLGVALGLFNRRLRVSALLERRAGFTQFDAARASQCGQGRCRAVVDPATPLDEQAESVLTSTRGFISPGDLTRLREVAVALDLPAGVARALRVRSATATLAGRNLALWTDFPGDPESADVRGVSGRQPASIPQGRSFSMRLDLGL